MSDYIIYIGQITQELQKEIAQEAASAEFLEFPESPLRYTEQSTETRQTVDCAEALQESVMYTQLLKNDPVLFYRNLTSYYACLRHVVIFCKRVIRKLVRFVMEPMVEEINRDRMFTVLALEDIQQHLLSQDVDVDAKQYLLTKIEQVSRENQRLSGRIKRLEAALESQWQRENGGVRNENTSAG